MSDPDFHEALDHWGRLLEAIAVFQADVAEAPVVGGTASALHAGHRFSMDADYVLDDLADGERFQSFVDFLEARDDWETHSINYGKLILGNFRGVDTGIRQLIRQEPLETEWLETARGPVRVPTAAEMLRIKGWLCLIRNTQRDYIDLAALSDHLGDEAVAEALRRFDACYKDVDSRRRERDTMPSVQLSWQLADPQPKDYDERNYAGLKAKWQDWDRVYGVCRQVATLLAEIEQQ